MPWGSHFRTASTTKAFVATVVLQLAAERQLPPDDTVEHWPPGVVSGNGNDGSRITVRDLLRQTSGLFDHVDDPGIQRMLRAHFDENRYNGNVDHLLKDESLGLRLLWAEERQLRQEISGVTATDLEDPARFVRPGEVVLSGLVWWTAEGGRDKAERFVSALRTAGAAVLLAGEEPHGAVPDDLIEACARHGVPLVAVPAHIMFRAITDTVYFQQWGELNRLHALPENVRVRLSRLVTQDAGPT
ncbi:PucR family transcriptional regulator ligand-binding domain-containing protein [Streptomyces sp. NPDC059697]|uniref:PucR family transcriptional regulator ligand-binding domain-containing protein n=1 Tax=Streptomyces sp. NPDC059697 TaxID=3346912 RepID=UPI0036C01468